jgi:apolipoprotein N-acyltransferase
VAGGTQPLPDKNYFNTAFVISPQGEIVHKQAKSVPIQFFKDGLPSQEQDVWQSPWGPIGICICYDLSYTRVTDGLIRKGATMILVPTLDELHWGKSQHLLHAGIAPMRSAEYRVPILRVGACGISQAVDEEARVIASTSFPAEGATLHAKLSPSQHARIPLDRFWVWIAGPVVLAELLASGYVRSTKCSATREPPARIV